MDQLGYARKEDFTGWDRVKLFFIRRTFFELDPDTHTIRYFKIYKYRKVLIREQDYR